MESTEFRSVLRVPFILLRIAGLLQTKDASRFYRIYGAIFRLLGIDLFVLCQLIYVCSAKSLLDLSDSLSFSFTYVILALKSYSYAGNMDKIFEQFSELEELMALVQKVEAKTMVKLKQRLVEPQIFFRIFWAACFAVTSTGALIPVVSYMLNPNPPYTVPYTTWFPFDYANEFAPFLFIAIYEGCNGMFYCGVVASLDILPMLLFNAGAGLLEELGARMSRIGMDMDGDEQEIDESKQNEDLKQLERCISLHLRIKSFIKKSESIFSFMIFVQGAVSLIILCTSAFSLTMVRFLNLSLKSFTI